MALNVYYDGKMLDLDNENAGRLLAAFQSGESGVIALDTLINTEGRVYRTLHVAYGPGIPFLCDQSLFGDQSPFRAEGTPHRG